KKHFSRKKKIPEKRSGFKEKKEVLGRGNLASWSTGVPVVGQVGQAGRVSWYAECHPTAIKPAGLPAQKTPQTDKKTPSGGKKKKLPHACCAQRNDRRNSQRRHSATHAVSSRRDDRAMMTKKERGDVNSRSGASPLF
ncbi:MAG: hypothetical protein J6R86_04935, partial [Lentisphaeria bacterium]|nr:hypothetical protein [Lentisphaeria bacterium]